jgi:hypothetical protein
VGLTHLEIYNRAPSLERRRRVGEKEKRRKKEWGKKKKEGLVCSWVASALSSRRAMGGS